MSHHASPAFAILLGIGAALGTFVVLKVLFKRKRNKAALEATQKQLSTINVCNYVRTEKCFAGKRALVTGAGKGLGRDICIQLAKSGAFVIAFSRTQEDLDSLKVELDAIGNGCQMIKVDMANTEELTSAAHAVGDIHLLVNNAGITRLGSLVELKVEDWDAVFNTNLRAVFVISQIIARKMITKGTQGSIVNVSSQASVVGLADHAAYCSSKGGLDQLTRTMALELGKFGIRVNSVNPTVVLTEMGKQAWSDPTKSLVMKNKIPLGKFADPCDISHAVVFLLSDNAAMINGVILPIDGGFLAVR